MFSVQGGEEGWEEMRWVGKEGREGGRGSGGGWVGFGEFENVVGWVESLMAVFYYI